MTHLLDIPVPRDIQILLLNSNEHKHTMLPHDTQKYIDYYIHYHTHSYTRALHAEHSHMILERQVYNKRHTLLFFIHSFYFMYLLYTQSTQYRLQCVHYIEYCVFMYDEIEQ